MLPGLAVFLDGEKPGASLMCTRARIEGRHEIPCGVVVKYRRTPVCVITTRWRVEDSEVGMTAMWTNELMRDRSLLLREIYIYRRKKE